MMKIKKKICDAICKDGRPCKNQSILRGKCLTHFVVKKPKKDYGLEFEK